MSNSTNWNVNPLELKSKVGRKRHKSFHYQVVTIIEPFATESHAKAIEKLWNFKSIAVAQRVI